MASRSVVVAVLALLTSTVGTIGERPPESLAHEWRLVDGRHWQIVSQVAPEAPDVTDAREGTRGRCAAGMVEVEGQMMSQRDGSFDAVEALQRSTCTNWISRAFPERCGRFDETRWAALSARIPRRALHFCIDRFEYPNRRGAYPWIVVNWDEARGVCASEGKRLCAEDEWTFACEGEGALPYPYGYRRDADACAIDRPWRPYDPDALFARGTARQRAELDRLWQGEASGARPRCRSPFGVYDMTGNVDEWTVATVPGPRASILKGGYWGPVRTRCRPSTRVHGADFVFYQQGFRCCSDVPTSARDAPHAG